MKQLASFFLIILVSITIFTVGCAAQPYPFINNIESIERIEIVVIDDSENYSTITSIPEVDKDAFLDEFGSVHFRRYIGDPPSLYGYVIRFVYIDESYEMVSWFTSEYVSNEKKRYILIGCDEEDFYAIIDKWIAEYRELPGNL